MYSKKIIQTSFIFAILTLAFFQFCQAIENSQKIVTISGQEVLLNSETGKAVQDKLKHEQTKLAEPLKKEEEKIKKLEEKFAADKKSLETDAAEFEKIAKTLSEESRNKKIEKLQERVIKLDDAKRELERMLQKFQAEAQKTNAKMGELYQKEMGKFENMVKETIKELAIKHGWDIVFMQEATAYCNPAISKTKEVIAALDAKTHAAAQAKKEKAAATKPTEKSRA